MVLTPDFKKILCILTSIQLLIIYIYLDFKFGCLFVIGCLFVYIFINTVTGNHFALFNFL